MRLIIAMRDVKTGSFEPPILAATLGEAERIYGDLLRNERYRYVAHPTDFPLYEVGKFDEMTGEVYPVMDGNKICPPRLLVDAAQLQLTLEA